ncbi:hypothetical protein VNO77_26978 [Canavalia gladiata]|uniref:ATP-dependent DNA helicase n=1 Tax=Canavalia gladiata TaxID=3824 RepID=A0AAN9KTU5_CANGL
MQESEVKEKEKVRHQTNIQQTEQVVSTHYSNLYLLIDNLVVPSSPVSASGIYSAVLLIAGSHPCSYISAFLQGNRRLQHLFPPSLFPVQLSALERSNICLFDSAMSNKYHFEGVIGPIVGDILICMPFWEKFRNYLFPGHIHVFDRMGNVNTVVAEESENGPYIREGLRSLIDFYHLEQPHTRQFHWIFRDMLRIRIYNQFLFEIDYPIRCEYSVMDIHQHVVVVGIEYDLLHVDDDDDVKPVFPDVVGLQPALGDDEDLDSDNHPQVDPLMWDLRLTASQASGTHAMYIPAKYVRALKMVVNQHIDVVDEDGHIHKCKIKRRPGPYNEHYITSAWCFNNISTPPLATWCFTKSTTHTVPSIDVNISGMSRYRHKMKSLDQSDVHLPTILSFQSQPIEKMNCNSPLKHISIVGPLSDISNRNDLSIRRQRCRTPGKHVFKSRTNVSEDLRSTPPTINDHINAQSNLVLTECHTGINFSIHIRTHHKAANNVLNVEPNEEREQPPSPLNIPQPTLNVEDPDTPIVGYWDIGDQRHQCQYCGALMWYPERLNKRYNTPNPKFGICCGQGKVNLSNLKNPPPGILLNLLYNNDHRSRHFIQNIRSFNMMFSFTSMGAKIDRTVNDGNGPPIFVLCGENYHRIGSLLPLPMDAPKFSQLYIYDTANEVANRISVVSMNNHDISPTSSIVEDLKDMLDEVNPYAKVYRMARDKLNAGNVDNLKLRIIGKRGKDGRRYNLPTVSEVAALIVGDFDSNECERDVIVETQNHSLKRLSILNAAYLPLQYPLLFPRGEDGYSEGIPLAKHICVTNVDDMQSADQPKAGRKSLSMREFIAFRLGRRIVLPATFTGGARYMFQNYQDAMAICRWTGYPDLFITFTCNQRWPEILRKLKPNGLSTEDRPDLLCCVFKVKLDHLIMEIKQGNVFGRVVLGRLHFVPPGSGELFYLRLLLNKVKGPQSYEDIQTVNKKIYPTLKEACYTLGLLDDDREYVDAINQANLYLPEENIEKLALYEIHKLLQSNNKILSDYSTMPQPDVDVMSKCHNRLILDELQYDKEQLARDNIQYLSTMTEEQHNIYCKIMDAVQAGQGKIFFLHGYGGTGKTFLWKSISAAIRSKGDIVLTVASSGIAALLLPGGRTAHSRFNIPINVDEDSTSNIKQDSPLAELILKAKLIIWDKAPMTHKYCFEVVDKTFRDILRFSNPDNIHKPFGGKVIVFGGDFRQILPVIPKDSRQDVVTATINSSYLWRYCEVLTLTKNMRLQARCIPSQENDLNNFSKWILSIGDDNDDNIDVNIPDEFLIHEGDDPIASIVHQTYPNYLANATDPTFFQNRAILAPTNDVVNIINDYMLHLTPGECRKYLSFDSPSNMNEHSVQINDIHTSKFLNTINCSGLPNHELNLKLYVAVSRVTQKKGLKLLITDKRGNLHNRKSNVVYKEVFRNVLE